MSGSEGTSNIVHEFEIELEQLQSRLDHLKAQVSLDFLCHSVDYHALQCSYAFYRCLHGTAPSYITESLLQTSDIDTQCSLHSTGTAMLVVLSTRHSTVGDHVFPVTLARAWNSLPGSIVADDVPSQTEDCTFFCHRLTMIRRSCLYCTVCQWLSTVGVSAFFALILYCAPQCLWHDSVTFISTSLLTYLLRFTGLKSLKWLCWC